MMGVKIFVVLAALLGLTLPYSAFPQEMKPGNWNIYFEPTAVLQTGTHVPFQITVHDPLHKPVVEARVTLQIETPDHTHVQVFKAPAIDQGVYMAKPEFPFAGQWSVLVEVHRADRESARTIEYNVPK
jgi:hypothetical protein